MNWLGELVRDRVSESDRILDLGCGIMASTGGPLTPRHLGVEAFWPAVKTCAENGAMVLRTDITIFAAMMYPRTWDVVLLLDVLEHLEKDDAKYVLQVSESTATRLVIAFTPLGHVKQDPYDEWGHGKVNSWQKHKCGFTEEEFKERGYKTSIHDNRSIQAGKFKAIFAVKEIEP